MIRASTSDRPDGVPDSARFATGLRHARQAEEAGSTTSARQTVGDALALWRGSALQDAVRYPFAVAEARRLDGLRHQAEELRAHLLLADGEPEAAAIAVEALVEAAPLREASWAILMRALYASGRAAEALRQYECFRIALAEDLGVDSGPGLRELHLAILRHDADALCLPRTRAVPSAAPDVDTDGRGGLLVAHALLHELQVKPPLIRPWTGPRVDRTIPDLEVHRTP
ncbi:BTAD domain-containing putative transcriptional regulator [Streptomyces sp. NPDC059828]|uniref:AfsR/SARP family transcriptional regulator n=1 Tax=Streptomyces sp. NPDC059828 TaxID=3346965 RepID=UPI003664A0BD